MTRIFLRIVLFLLFLEILLRTGGFVSLYIQECQNIASLAKKGSYVILCLGESTTALGGKDAYPSQLEKILNERNTGIKFTVINKGLWATDSGTIVSLLKSNLDKYSPQMVIAMIGINDERYGLPQRHSWIDFISSFKTVKMAKYLYASFIQMEHNLHSKEFSGSDDYVLGRRYMLENKFTDAIKTFNKALRVTPDKAEIYYYLGWLYFWPQNDLTKAEMMYKKYIDLKPQDGQGYLGLGDVYFYKKDFKNAEIMLKKALELEPTERFYLELSWFYQRTGRPEKALETMKLYQSKDKNGIFYGFLGQLYLRLGKHQSAEECFKKAEEIRSGGYIMKTKRNYQRIAEELFKRKIKLVCVQYPVRSIIPLKKMLDGYNGVIFVDNEKIFKDAILHSNYDDYFSDRYGGDFGHATPKGNRLLAGNIADVILSDLNRFKQLAQTPGP